MTEQDTRVSQLPLIDAPEKFVQTRELRGMSKGEVAQRLKLAPKQLDALERGDWAALPGRAFVRGSIRSYGRLLNADVEPLLQTVGGFAEPEMLRSSSSLDAPLPRAGAFGFAGEGRGNLIPWLLLIAAVVVALGLFFGRSGDMSGVKSWLGGDSAAPGTASPAGSGFGSAPRPTGAGGALPTVVPPPLLAPPPPPPPPAVQDPVVQAPAAAAANPTDAKAASATGAAGASPGAATTATGAAATPAGSGSAQAPAAAATPGAAPAAAAPVRLVAAQDAWVEVRQGDGKVVFSGTVKAGAPAEWNGVAPFSLVIGNASQVKLEYQGRPVEVKPAANGIARVKLQ